MRGTWSTTYTNNHRAKSTNLNGNKINNPGYDTPLEVRYWRHPAELPTMREVENGSKCTTEMYTDGSKSGDNFGAAGIIFVNGKLVHKLKFKQQGHCYNNQAKEIAILKILEKLERLQFGHGYNKRVAIYTDSKINLDLLKNNFKRHRLIEYIRDKMIALTHLKWIMHFGWVRGRAGIEGNELVNKLAKEAAVEDGPVLYDKIPKQVLIIRVKENALNIWQQQRTQTWKGSVTKALFSPLRNRLREKFLFSQNLQYF
jgi:ribonuclease HI